MGRRRLRQESREPRTIQPLPSHQTPLCIRQRDLEYGFCEINGHCRSIHLGLLLVTLMAVS
jgi:hypothetical protein